MKTIKLTVSERQKAPRVELLVRLVYWIPLYIVMLVFAVLAFFAIIVNFGSILIRGMRSARLAALIKSYSDYRYKFEMYLLGIVDERPPILPE